MSSRFPMPGAWDISWDNPNQNDEDPNSVCTTPPGQLSPSQDMTAPKEDGNYTNPELELGSELQIWKSHSGVSDRPISLDDVAETPEHRDNTPPIVIAVFGKTGTGKTSFIKAVAGKDLKVGHSLTSCTEDVLAVPCRVDGKNVMLVDTPGFSDTNLSDTEILRRIATWMKDNYDDGFLLSGIIYLHRIIDVRMEGPSLKNLRMMRALCGENSLKNVVLATTMWERVPEEEGSRREAELKDLFWKDMIAYGSAVKRILTESGDDARTLVKSMLTNRPTSTRLQDELHSGKTLVQTEAGIEIREEIAKLERKLKKEHEMDMAELKQAQNQRNEELQSRIRAEMEENRQRIVRLETEKRELERVTFSRDLPRARRKGIFGMGRYPCLFCDEMETYKVGRWTCKLCNNQQINVIS